QALKERLTAFGGNAAKAFAEPFYKPKSDGSRGPLVKKVKIMEKSTLTVPVLQNTAVADNGAMVRVDVFFVEGKGYYLVPIYVADTVKADLPNKAIKAHKPYGLWEEMREEDFVFSLYPNDVIKITSSKEMKFLNVNPNSTLPNSVTRWEAFVYYRVTNISTAAITAITHDHTYEVNGLGVQRLKAIEKYTVDVLGNLSKTGKEKRMRF
ncbi:MAG: type II CRISPR RNA-guided endonuclease Cas9, partial [Clostridia bacterium]|nr:type II CRISPR RNA-guided endonuclease Cas9 [Clostridia bacterium]